MSGWSPKEAIAMERRHVLEGENRIARQIALVTKLNGCGNAQLAKSAVELLDLQQDLLKLSKTRLQQLEDQFGKAPSPL
jgi:hypothetical protein